MQSQRLLNLQYVQQYGLINKGPTHPLATLHTGQPRRAAPRVVPYS